MSEPYTDTYIIDCNRTSSIEADAGTNENPAFFTNNQGQGLKLNRGDKVQIHSAFINEIGNTDGTIEFKGETIKDTHQREITYELTETEDFLTNQFPLDNVFSKNTDAPWTAGGPETTLDKQWEFGEIQGGQQQQILQPYGFSRCDVVNTTKTYVLKDNEMNIQVGYYKTGNGENYMHLPRRFDCFSGRAFGASNSPFDLGGSTPVTTKKVSTRFSNEETLAWAYKGMQWAQAPMTQIHENWKANGSVGSVQPESNIQAGYADGGWNGNITRDVRVQSQVPEDWDFYQRGERIKNETLDATKDPFAQGIATKSLNSLGTTKRYRWANDNSRYQIFKKERTYFSTAPQFVEFLTEEQRGDAINISLLAGSKTNDFLGYINAAATEGGHSPHPGYGKTDGTASNYYWNTRDPAITGNWVPYYEIKNIKIDAGFKAPEDIAEEVSRVLNKTGEVEEIYGRIGNIGTIPASATELGARHAIVGLKKDGELFKSFYSTNHAHFNSANAKQYFTEDAGKSTEFPEKHSANIKYMSAYHYLGVKRPELWITGRKFCETSMGVIAVAGHTWGEVPEFIIHPKRPAITLAGQLGADICTNIPWSERHLLKDFVVSQGVYPELFDYPYSQMKEPGSFYASKSEVSSTEFQMGNSQTGERLAGFIHYNLLPDDSKLWRFGQSSAADGPQKGGGRRLGNDGYEYQKDTDSDAIIPGAETATGYALNPTEVPNAPPNQAQKHVPVPVPFWEYGSHAHLSGNLPFYDLSSVPLWFFYDQSRAETDGGGNALDCDDLNLCYGFMKIYNPYKEGDSADIADNLDFIAFSTERIGGIPDFFFQTGGNPNSTTYLNTISSTHKIGVDRHFSAYGTKCIIPYSGDLNATQPDLAQTKVGKENSDIAFVGQPGAMPVPSGDVVGTAKLEETYGYNLSTYIGANAIALNYDGDTQKRFNFSDLHTPEYIGNNYNAGSTAGDPIADDQSNQVYKINKRLSGANFCPEMMPYNTDVTTDVADPKNPLATIKIASSNWNLTQWRAIFDASSGVLFKSFGGTDAIKKHWHKTLWGILGFSYEQFNFQYVDNKNTNYKSRSNLNTRINPENQGQTPDIFTNALVKTSDVSLFRTNMYGAQLFTQQGVSSGGRWHCGLLDNGKITNTDAQNINNPAISVSATSIGIKADRQPTKMLRPYYLIKSNIIGDMKYIGSGHSTDGGQKLPIIGVVNKENGFGDYYFQTDQKAVFTITSDVTLTEIQTSIHDPDMSHSRVDKNSAVLYMVTKQNNNNLNIIETLLQDKVIPPTALEPPVMTDAQYNTYFNSIINTEAEQVASNQGFVQSHYDQGGEMVNPVPDEVRARGVESYLGMRQGENPSRIIGSAREGISEGDEVHNIPQGTLTRTQARNLEAFRGIQERARADMNRRFVPSGRSNPEQSGEMPGWYQQALANAGEEVRNDSTLTSQVSTTTATSESSVVTAPSDPQSAPSQPEPEQP